MKDNVQMRTEARLQYGDGDFAVVSSGDFVTCAMTGKAIPLAELRYWSVSRQEPYADAAVANAAYAAARERNEEF